MDSALWKMGANTKWWAYSFAESISLITPPSHTLFLFLSSSSVAESLYNSHLSVRPSVADCALFNLSLTSSNWSVDRAISVLALSSDKGQTPFPAAELRKVGEFVCVCARAHVSTY